MSADLKAQDLPMPPGPIEGPAAWYGPAMDASKTWLREFSSDELAELDTAMRSIQAKGLGVIDITRETFPLPKLEPILGDIRAELINGRGFTLMRGIPVDNYTIEESAMVYYGLGVHARAPRAAERKGSCVGSREGSRISPRRHQCAYLPNDGSPNFPYGRMRLCRAFVSETR